MVKPIARPNPGRMLCRRKARVIGFLSYFI
jgi:hypothetical protein